MATMSFMADGRCMRVIGELPQDLQKDLLEILHALPGPTAQVFLCFRCFFSMCTLFLSLAGFKA